MVSMDIIDRIDDMLARQAALTYRQSMTDTPPVRLSAQTTLFHIVGIPAGPADSDLITFHARTSDDEGFEWRTFHMTRRDHEDMGSPLMLTVRVEPGDRLNTNIPAALEQAADAERALIAAVRRAREDGRSWAYIGDLLGVTRQSAWDRFAKYVDRPTEDDGCLDPDEHSPGSNPACIMRPATDATARP